MHVRVVLARTPHMSCRTWSAQRIVSRSHVPHSAHADRGGWTLSALHLAGPRRPAHEAAQ
eukprot:351965-Chlamydomonas_euryale.AAC.15